MAGAGQPRVAVITGASSGIGRACAEGFLRAGWQVAGLARRAEKLGELATLSEQMPGAFLPLRCDVADAGAVDDAFAEIVRVLGRVDVLFNNAGIFTPAALPDEVALADWDRAVAVNLSGAFYCARAAFAQMRRQTPQGGRIINNGSVSAHVPREGAIAYTATKHAITGLTKQLSLDGRALNIACGQIDIGNAETDMLRALRRKAEEEGRGADAIPSIDVGHVVDAVLWMADLPLEANVQFMTLMATRMPYIGRG